MPEQSFSILLLLLFVLFFCRLFFDPTNKRFPCNNSERLRETEFEWRRKEMVEWKEPCCVADDSMAKPFANGNYLFYMGFWFLVPKQTAITKRTDFV